ncbi:MAG: hypothetical protein MH252_02735 [Thermosynechococcaceae cyanobacterium MS004]|nr:hypothetical protein [Thermosynechococcaceae cyanobacterium MS004]
MHHRTHVRLARQAVVDQLQQMPKKLDPVLGGQAAIAQQLSQIQHRLRSQCGVSERSAVL